MAWFLLAATLSCRGAGRILSADPGTGDRAGHAVVAGLAGEQQPPAAQRLRQRKARIGVSRTYERIGATHQRVSVPAGDEVLAVAEQPVHPAAEQRTQLAECEVHRRRLAGARQVPGHRPADPALHVVTFVGPALEPHGRIAAAL